MLWPVLRALSIGELTDDQLTWVRETFGLTDGPRTEGPAAEDSLAHRTLTDEHGVELILDLAGLDDDAWVFTLFRTTAENPSAVSVEGWRAAFRAAIDHLNLELVEIQPAATADEVLLAYSEPTYTPESAFRAHWAFPDELDLLWPHLGLLRDAPRKVKQVKLRDLMLTPAWDLAPASLHQQAKEFLDGN
ncbi:hypothetical protein ACQPYH_33200 [Kribbella sp. CA-245084]|uniref:hypothetical protein n=1 Tax=Kribbella sp. CA-245084 TaxID=3239940 RepID=UPI003D93D427